MQVPAERILAALRPTLDRLIGDKDQFGSDQEAIRSALTLLHNRERSGMETQRAQFRSLNDLTRSIAASLALSSRAPDLAQQLADIAEQARIASDGECLAALEDDARRVLADMAKILVAVAGDDRLDPAERPKAVAAVADWEVRQIRALGSGRTVATETDKVITADALTRYLADRFDEPGMVVTDIHILPGGFGKETILFSVNGKAIAGDFVLRRDRQEPTVDNDCHRVVNEFPVIRSAFAAGFPAPDAIWLDTDHRLLPGGDFFVMRRAPGKAGGDVFSAAGSISDDLLEVLAQALAHLHALPPLLDLGDLTESIDREAWSLSLSESTRRYITGFRDIYLRDVAELSPAILALYGWVVDNIPAPEGRPALCHGDVGFHNLILHDGKLSVLVDWEFAHVGDPAEDLAYIRNTAGDSLNWDRFLAAYRAAGGRDIEPRRIAFFQVWGHLRNATASAMTINCLVTGKHDELKLAHTGFYHLPSFLEQASLQMKAFNEAAGDGA